jgi:2-iminobutanoate/2-iminopropanoate deaminase
MGKEHPMQESAHGAKRAISSGEGIPASHASYSPAIIHGSTVYVSGQAALDPKTGDIAGGDFRAQAELTLQNLMRVAAAAGVGAGDAVRVNVHLADLNDFGTFDEVYRRYFLEPYPTRVTVGSQLLDGLLIEVDAIFALPAGAAGDGPPAK